MAETARLVPTTKTTSRMRTKPGGLKTKGKRHHNQPLADLAYCCKAGGNLAALA